MSDDSYHSQMILDEYFFFSSRNGVLKMIEIDSTITRHRV